MKLSEYITRLQKQLDDYGDGPIYFISPQSTISTVTPPVDKENPIRHYAFDGFITTAVGYIPKIHYKRKEEQE